LPGSEDHLKLHKAGAYLDPDLNKYDLEHVTASHATMSTAEWERLYQDAWYSYYSLEHLETVMRRAHATGSNPGNMLLLLLWFYACIRLENVDPLQGGYLRRKYRKDRRPALPIENPFVFYPRYFGNLLSKHITLAGLIVKYGLIRAKLKRDRTIRNYVDDALRPVEEELADSSHVTSPNNIVTISNARDESLAIR
jgi:hypothetical protein